MNEQPKPNTPETDAEAGNPQSPEPKSRPLYDTTISESTRELRDTSRRRREAEEKLQQHLLEAKDHVPHQHDQEQRQEDAGPGAGKADAAGGADPAGPRKSSEPTRDSESGDG